MKNNRATRSLSFIDKTYKNLSKEKERLNIDVINSVNQYQGVNGK